MPKGLKDLIRLRKGEVVFKGIVLVMGMAWVGLLSAVLSPRFSLNSRELQIELSLRRIKDSLPALTVNGQALRTTLKNLLENRTASYELKVDANFLKRYNLKWYMERKREGATAGTRGLIDISDFEKGQFNMGVVLFDAQSIANYIKKEFPPDKWQVAVGFDTRYHSAAYAWAYARVLAANRIKVLDNLNHNPASTAAIAFQAPLRGLATTIVITASHNPANQNGAKTLTEYGGQDTDDISEKYLKYQEELYNEGEGKGNILLGPENSPLITQVDFLKDYYENNLVKEFATPEVIKTIREAMARGWKFAVDGLGGVGGMTIRYVFDQMFGQGNWEKNIFILNETPDSNMLGIPYPDPSKPEVLEQSGLIPKMVNEGIEIGAAGDNDWDRIGFAIIIKESDVTNARKYGLDVAKIKDTYVVRFTPNQIFTLIDDFNMQRLVTRGRKNHSQTYLLTTFPSSLILEQLANFYKAKTVYTSVGFKNQARGMLSIEQTGPKDAVVLAMQEESGGWNRGNLSGKDERGSLGFKYKCTTATILDLMNLSARLFLNNMSLLNAYVDMAKKLGVLDYFERVDVYSPDFNASLKDPETANRLKKESSMAADALENEPQKVAQLLGSELSSSIPRAVILHNATLYQKVALGEQIVNGRRVRDGEIIWTKVYADITGDPLPHQVNGVWKEIPVEMKVYNLKNGKSFGIFHAGEGPKVILFDEKGKEEAWILIRPSGTEPGLIRIYMEIVEKNLDNPDPYRLVNFVRPFLEYLNMGGYVAALEKRLRDKYPR
jgi:phosphomannomutase